MLSSETLCLRYFWKCLGPGVWCPTHYLTITSFNKRHCAVRGSTEKNRKGLIARLLLILCLRHIAGVNWKRNKYYYSDYSVGEYHAGRVILWPSVLYCIRESQFNHEKATFWIAGSNRTISPAHHHLCVIVTSFKGEHAFQAPSVVGSEVETHSHKKVRVNHSKSFEVSSQPRWVYV